MGWQSIRRPVCCGQGVKELDKTCQQSKKEALSRFEVTEEPAVSCPLRLALILRSIDMTASAAIEEYERETKH